MFSRRRPLVSVVVPVYDVAAYLPACLDSILAQRHRALDVVVVDDGSTDESGAIADRYAERDDRVRVLHVANGGLGAARNVGVAEARGDYLTFADSDDTIPPDAYARLIAAVRKGEADFAVGNILRLEGDLGAEREIRLPWMDGMHAPYVGSIEERPELLGDVFAWNKLFRREFWDAARLSWPERIRYEDQPTTTEAYLRAERVAVLDDVVYHWRIRGDGSAITEQRATVADLRDRWRTKQMALDSTRALGSPALQEVFRTQVLPGDMWRYFLLVPGATDEWWALLVAMVQGLWGDDALVRSGLGPAHRLTGWLVTHDRRADAALVMSHLASREGQPIARVDGRLDVPGLDTTSIDPAALVLRPHEA
ncbi:glycosyltransferase [Pimelobacter simplex]|uniref:Glycosyltransferase n=1 Tax=Nocardioides simplex TaxID=2045 RepID=A0A7J5DT36_NOCSI|nr:glycosyltransferase [Pimelobacter simplex]KAB2808205.1 glycosyltransferase [Pimelobacter simplex]